MEENSKKLLNFRELFGNTGEKSFVCRTWGSVKNAIIGSSVAMVFGMAILILSLYSIAVPTGVRPFEGEVKSIEYYLPYPGILPDSPLYKVKVLRDWVWVRSTNDQRVRAERELLLADKRINAAWVLVEGGKTGLGVATAAKAQLYLEESAGRAEQAMEKGVDAKSVLLSLEKAALKHAELMDKMKAKLKDEELKLLGDAMSTNSMTQQTVKQAMVESF